MPSEALPRTTKLRAKWVPPGTHRNPELLDSAHAHVAVQRKRATQLRSDPTLSWPTTPAASRSPGAGPRILANAPSRTTSSPSKAASGPTPRLLARLPPACSLPPAYSLPLLLCWLHLSGYGQPHVGAEGWAGDESGGRTPARIAQGWVGRGQKKRVGTSHSEAWQCMPVGRIRSLKRGRGGGGQLQLAYFGAVQDMLEHERCCVLVHERDANMHVQDD